jgi:NAD(P)-dependent dehydrogenase (short-subunit alcohol dehydrogenase family)
MMEGRAAFITGGTGAVGPAVVARLLEEGYRVAVSYRKAAEWEALARARERERREGRLEGFETDVTDEGSLERGLNAAAARFQGLSSLVHLAGGYTGGTPVRSVDAATVRGMIELNLLSSFWAAKHAIPHVARSGTGRLLFVSSRAAIEPQAGAAAYAASKAGLAALVGALARELKEEGVTVNAIAPSVIDTAANRAAMPKADFSRWVRPESIAALLAFLASDAASAITGTLIPIHGRS